MAGGFNANPAISALGQLGQSNALVAQRFAQAEAERKRRHQQRMSSLGAIAGAIAGGALAAPTGGMSIAAGASLGSSAGGMLGGAAAGRPPSTQQVLNTGLGALQFAQAGRQADMQQQQQQQRAAFADMLTGSPAQPAQPGIPLGNTPAPQPPFLPGQGHQQPQGPLAQLGITEVGGQPARPAQPGPLGPVPQGLRGPLASLPIPQQIAVTRAMQPMQPEFKLVSGPRGGVIAVNPRDPSQTIEVKSPAPQQESLTFKTAFLEGYKSLDVKTLPPPPQVNPEAFGSANQARNAGREQAEQVALRAVADFAARPAEAVPQRIAQLRKASERAFRIGTDNARELGRLYQEQAQALRQGQMDALRDPISRYFLQNEIDPASASTLDIKNAVAAAREERAIEVGETTKARERAKTAEDLNRPAPQGVLDRLNTTLPEGRKLGPGTTLGEIADMPVPPGREASGRAVERASMEDAIDIVQEIKDAYSPDLVGNIFGRWAKIKTGYEDVLPGVSASPDERGLVTLTERLRNTLVRMSAGKAQTQTEFNRMLDEVPRMSDPPATFVQKLKLTERNIRRINSMPAREPVSENPTRQRLMDEFGIVPVQ